MALAALLIIIVGRWWPEREATRAYDNRSLAREMLSSVFNNDESEAEAEAARV